MTISKRDLFEELEPPPGGAALLRARIERERALLRLPRALLPASAAVAATAVILVWMTFGARLDHARVIEAEPGNELAALVTGHPASVGLGMAAEPGEPVVIVPETQQRYLAARVATPNEDVIFYWVAPAEVPESGN